MINTFSRKIFSSLKLHKFSSSAFSFRSSFSISMRNSSFSIINNPKLLEIATNENSLENLHSEEIDRTMMKAALIGYGENLKLCKKFGWNSDRELVLIAVRNNRMESALQFASEELRDDEEVVEVSLKEFASSFRFASERIRADKRMGLKAVSYLPSNIFYLSESLQKDVDIIKRTLELDGELILSMKYNQEETMENKEILLNVLKECSLFCKEFIFTHLQGKDSDLLKDQQVLHQFIFDSCINQRNNGRYSQIRQLEIGKNLLRRVVETGNLVIDRDLIVEKMDLFQYASNDIKSDRFFVSKIVGERSDLLEFVDEKLKDDSRIVKSAIMSNEKYPSIQFASERLRNDVGICHQAVLLNGKQFIYVSESLKSNKEFILSLLDTRPSIFEFIPDHLKGDLNFLEKALKISTMIAPHVTNLDKKLFEFILKNRSIYTISRMQPNILKSFRSELVEHLRKNPSDYYFIKNFSDDLEMSIEFGIQESTDSEDYMEMDREILINMVKKDPWLYNRLPEKLQKDRELAWESVKGGNTIAVSSHFNNDREIVLEAIKGHYFSLGDVCSDLRKDVEIVKQAMKRDPSNIVYAHHVFLTDREFIKNYFENGTEKNSYDFGFDIAMNGLSESMRDNDELAKLALKQSYANFMYLSERLRSDRSIATPIIMRHPNMLCYSPTLRKDKQFVLELIENSESLFFIYSFNIPSELERDPDILAAIFKKDPETYMRSEMFPSKVFLSNKNLIKLIIPYYPSAFFVASKEIRKDPEVFDLFVAHSSKVALTI